MLRLALHPSRTFPFLRRDRVAECRRALALRHPCGLVGAPGGGTAFWMGFPTDGGETLVVAGHRADDGEGHGVRFRSVSAPGALPAEVRSRLASPSAAITHGGAFVDAVLAALSLDGAAAELAENARSVRNLGMTLGLQHSLRFGRLKGDGMVAFRLGLDAGLTDLRAAAVLRADRRRPAGGQARWAIRVADMRAGADVLADLARTVSAPFLATVEGHALSFARADLSHPAPTTVLARMADATWREIDGGGGIAPALARHPEHADLLVAAAGCPGPRRTDIREAAACGAAVRPVSRRVTESYLRSDVGSTIGDTMFSADAEPLRPDVPWAAPAGSDPLGGWGSVTSHATAALGFLGLLPPEWCPSCSVEWDAFARLAPHLMRVAAVAHRRGTHAPPWGGLLNVGGRWKAYEARLRTAGGTHGVIVSLIDDLRDVEAAYADHVVIPALEVTRPPGRGLDVETETATLHARLLAARALWSGRSLPRMLEASRDWHAAQGRMATEVERVDGGLAKASSWDPGFPDMAFGEVEVRCLRTAAELRHEGGRGPDPDGAAGLGHCVGSYVGRCASGRSRILSLRRKGAPLTERLSTAEVELRSRKVIQHRGAGNGDPSPECVAALAAYMVALASGEARVSRVRKVRDTRVPAAVAAAGYDFRVPGRVEAVRNLWSPFLPAPRRGWTPARYRAEALGIASEAAAGKGPPPCLTG